MTIKFSVIIPAHNEEADIGQCLRSLDRMDYPEDRYEVIVVDDASTDRTPDIAREHGARVITKNCSSIAEVRNTGAREAQGEIVAHLDADMIVDPNWLKRAEQYYDNGFEGVLYFKEDVPEDAGWLARMWYGPFRADKSKVREMAYLATCNLFVPKALHDSVGGLDEALSAGRKGGSDKEYTFRMGALGSQLLLDPTLHMIHLGYEKSLGEFLRKEFWRQGNSLFLARKFGYPMRLLRAPLISLWHLLATLGFVVFFIAGWPTGMWLSLAAWVAPTVAILAVRMNVRRHWRHLPGVFAVTFLRWTVAGFAQVPQYFNLLVDRGAAS